MYEYIVKLTEQSQSLFAWRRDDWWQHYQLVLNFQVLKDLLANLRWLLKLLVLWRC